MSFVVALLFAFGGYSTSAREYINEVDLVEFCKVYNVNEDGKEVFGYDEVIFWEWNAEYRRFDVRQWFIIEDGPDDDYNGLFISRSGEYYNIRFSGRYDRDTQFNVRTKSLKYSKCHSSEDPENLNKKVLPDYLRRKMMPAKAKKRYPKTEDFDESGNLINPERFEMLK